MRRAGASYGSTARTVSKMLPALLPGCSSPGTAGNDAIQRLTTGEVLLEIGVVEGDPEYQFSTLSHVESLPDGAVLTMDVGARELAVYEADGTHRWTAGGAGDAPGEFGFLLGAGHDADRVFGWDFQGRRVTWFRQSDGELLSSDVFAGVEPFTFVFGRFSDGALLFHEEEMSPPGGPDALITSEASFVRMDAAGAADTIWLGPGPPWSVSPQGVIQMVPLTVRAEGAVRGDTVWLLRPIAGGLQRILPDGTGTTIGDTSRVPLTDEMRSTFRERTLEETEEDQREQVGGWLDAAALIEHIPMYDRLVLGTDGRVWLQRHEPLPGDTRTWEVFSAGGALVAAAHLPSTFKLTEAGANDVLGIWRNELDVSFVRRYALVPATPSPEDSTP